MQGEVTKLCHLWTIRRRDGVTYRFTTLDRDISFEGNTYYAGRGSSTSAMEFRITMAVSNAEIIGFLDDLGISEHDLIAGFFDRADIKMAVLNWGDVSQGQMKTLRGRCGNFTRIGTQYISEVRSL